MPKKRVFSATVGARYLKKAFQRQLPAASEQPKHSVDAPTVEDLCDKLSKYEEYRLQRRAQNLQSTSHRKNRTQSACQRSSKIPVSLKLRYNIENAAKQKDFPCASTTLSRKWPTNRALDSFDETY